MLEEDKEYIGEIKLGMVSTTDDEEGRKSKVKSQKSKVHKVYKVESLPRRMTWGRKSVKSKGASRIFKAVPLPERSEREVWLLKILRNKESNKKSSKVKWPTIEEIEKVIQENFIGDIVQTTPTYSAVKIGGERAYKKARRGEKFTRPPRIVTIKEIEILDYSMLRGPASQPDDEGNYPILKIRAVVGSGTYIRSLAREIGEKLGTGGYLKSLVRTRIGNYKMEDSVKL